MSEVRVENIRKIAKGMLPGIAPMKLKVLARRVGLHPSTLSTKFRTPDKITDEFFCTVAAALGVTVEMLDDPDLIVNALRDGAVSRDAMIEVPAGHVAIIVPLWMEGLLRDILTKALSSADH